MKTKKKTWVKVADVTSLSFGGVDWEKFDTLAEAFAWIASEIEQWAGDGSFGERFEIKVPGSEETIQIDARYVDFSTLFDDEDAED